MNTINIKALSEQVSKLSSSGGGSDLPEVTSADNGKVLGVVEGSWNKMNAPSSVIDYSTTEQNTGIKWIDGKDIYSKTIEYTMTSDLLQVIGSDVYDNVIYASGFILHTSGQSVKRLIICGDIFLSNDSFCRFGMNNDGNFVLQQKGFDTEVVYINLLYTKPTPEPITKATKKKTTK